MKQSQVNPYLLPLLRNWSAFRPRTTKLDSEGRPVRAARKCALPGCLVQHAHRGGYCCAAHCKEHTEGDRAARELERLFERNLVDCRDGKIYLLHDGASLAGDPVGSKVLWVCRSEDEVRAAVPSVEGRFTLAQWFEHEIVGGQVVGSKPRPDLYAVKSLYAHGGPNAPKQEEAANVGTQG